MMTKNFSDLRELSSGNAIVGNKFLFLILIGYYYLNRIFRVIIKFKVLFVKTLRRNLLKSAQESIKFPAVWKRNFRKSETPSIIIARVGSINLLTLHVLFRPFAIYDFYFASQLKNIVDACQSLDKFSSISFNEFIIYRLDE